MFHSLPYDLQRFICNFLSYKEILKLSPKFFDNEDDVYWKMKVAAVTDEKTPNGMTHYKFYCFTAYEEPIRNGEYDKIFNKMVEDELFLSKYINVQDVYGWTILFCATYYNCQEIIKKLLKHGANPDIQSKQGNTPLTISCVRGYNLIEIFLQANANINCQNIDGENALIYSVSYEKIENVRLLLAAGADISLKTKKGMTAMTYALKRENSEIIQLLQAAGATE
jgi:ankyrin repeat protein